VLNYVGDLCPDESVVINGTIYDAQNPTGVEVIVGGAANGCDSIIHVELTFLEESVLYYMAELCPGDTLFINGSPYHAGRLEGTEVIEGGNWQGCDSTIFVSLSLAPLPELVAVDVVNDDGSGSGSIAVVIQGGTPPYQYFWSNGATEPVIEGLTAGTYSLTVEDDKGCQVEFTFEVQMVSATEDLREVEALRVFPNPVGSARVLNVQWSFPEEVQLFLVDARGVMVRRQTGVDRAALELEGLPAGAYVLVLSWDGVPLARRQVLLLPQ
ncbi:MAG: T9SS C-terminal target domain-containing protein, partial [Bacteroidetes bacterium]